MYRNTPHGKPPWSRPVFPDMTPDQIDWKAFLGGAPAREFDANRYVNWRYFWDYSGGNVHENMSHQLAFWYKVMDLRIPWAVTMTGGIYRWKDGREVPDTMTVAMEHPEHELQFTWDSGFGSNHPGVTEEVLGTDGTIVRGQQIRYMPQRVNRPEGAEMLGQTPTPPHSHMRNFLDCIRHGGEPGCPLRDRVPRLGRLPHGRGKLPAGPHGLLGRFEGRNRLNAETRARCLRFAGYRSGHRRNVLGGARPLFRGLRSVGVARSARPQSDGIDFRRRPRRGHGRDSEDSGPIRRTRDILSVRAERAARAGNQPLDPRLRARDR